MTATTVAQIDIGARDYTGALIVRIIGKVSRRYAVYQSETGVMIQFSDDDDEGANQRAALTPIEPLRGRIDTMIEALRRDGSQYQRDKASDYGVQLGRSLVIALRGNVALAEAELVKVSNDMIEDRASDTRTRHLAWACVATAAAIVISAAVAADWFMDLFARIDRPVWAQSWYAAALGSLGALFSIALQLRSRTVPIDAQSWDNISDAVLRIFVGALSAVLLVALLGAKFVNLSVDGDPLPESATGLIVVAFTAGFAERLVAEFLSRFALSIAQTTATTTPTLPPPAGATEKSVTGETPAAGGMIVAAPAPPTTAATDHEQASEPDEDEADAAGGEAHAGQLKPLG